MQFIYYGFCVCLLFSCPLSLFLQFSTCLFASNILPIPRTNKSGGYFVACDQICPLRMPLCSRVVRQNQMQTPNKTQISDITTNFHKTWSFLFYTLKGVLHRSPTPKLACFVLYLKIINTFLKNNVCIL